MSSNIEKHQSLREELLTMIHDFAEYEHPCDADEKRLSKATGSISIHTLMELLDRHPESLSAEELADAVSPKRTRGELEFSKLFGAKG